MTNTLKHSEILSSHIPANKEYLLHISASVGLKRRVSHSKAALEHRRLRVRQSWDLNPRPSGP